MEATDYAELIPGLADQATMHDLSDGVRQHLMHLMLSDEQFFVTNLHQLRPEYLADPHHQLMLVIAREHYEAHRQLPSVDVLTTELRRRVSASEEAVAIAELSSITEYVEDRVVSRDYLQREIDQFCRRERVMEGLRAAVHAAQAGEVGDVEKIMAQALADVAPPAQTRSIRDIDDWIEELIADERDGVRCTLGFPGLDQTLDGGMRPGELAVFIGLPGAGKSAMLIHVGLQNVRAGKRVLHVSLENDLHRTMGRYYAALCDIPMSEFLPRLKKMREAWPAIEAELRGDLKLKWFPSRSATVSDLRQMIRDIELREGWRPEVLVVDYLDDFSPVRNVPTHESQQMIAGELRGLAGEIGAFCLSATQPNRQATTVAIITGNEIGDSFGKIRVVDLMVSINADEWEARCNLARLYVMKSRNGEARKTIHLKAQLDRGRFVELAEHEYQEQLEKGKDRINREGSRR